MTGQHHKQKCERCGGEQAFGEVGYLGGVRVEGVLLDVPGVALVQLCRSCCPACGGRLKQERQTAWCVNCE